MDKYPLKYLVLRITKWDESNEVVDGSKQFNSGSNITNRY